MLVIFLLSSKTDSLNINVTDSQSAQCTVREVNYWTMSFTEDIIHLNYKIIFLMLLIFSIDSL